MMKIEKARPEVYLFLPEAFDAMQAYHKKYNTYPKEWHLLDMTFANGPYRVSDPGVAPSPELGSRWKPKGCTYTYVIEKADKTEFLIQAFNSSEMLEFEIDHSSSMPRELSKAVVK